mmetsp:Transcript_112129/g.219833  ORF Transcript_112129/g.219833 Transcript_112129/m.219833 type:complete len:147 (-) Transcript_112129:262-702(-)
MRHLDLLVDPVEGIEDAVPAQGDDVQARPHLVPVLAVTEDVLRDHGEAFDELREGPEHLQHGVLAGEEHRGGDARDDDDCQIAGVVPAFVRGAESVEEPEDDHGRQDVCELEEHQVRRLRVVEQVQIPGDKHQEVQNLCAPGDSPD